MKHWFPGIVCLTFLAVGFGSGFVTGRATSPMSAMAAPAPIALPVAFVAPAPAPVAEEIDPAACEALNLPNCPKEEASIVPKLPAIHMPHPIRAAKAWWRKHHMVKKAKTVPVKEHTTQPRAGGDPSPKVEKPSVAFPANIAKTKTRSAPDSANGFTHSELAAVSNTIGSAKAHEAHKRGAAVVTRSPDGSHTYVRTHAERAQELRELGTG